MPTYEYECGSCGNRFEKFQSMSDQPVKTCPKCGEQVHRVINGGLGVIFKGPGFYVTDNHSTGSEKSESARPKKEETAKPESSTQANAKANTSANSAKANAEVKTEKTRKVKEKIE
ncbi:MAG: zinc ribbon domain-containing protein [Spirochaetaceae bacterium]|jgi:putative FmdB family regulatory protein|nr:zinc ribbon domain-containing protein [Spirochaetaceae bacterium]